MRLDVTRPESVVLGRDPEVLQGLLDFYAEPGASVVDTTANARRMWKGVAWAGKVTYLDLDPKVAPDVVADFRALPLEPATVDVLVWDPPHLPAAAGTDKSHGQMKADYGLAGSLRADNVSDYHEPFLREAVRVLRPDGLVFAKLKDFVHNHAYQWSLVDFVNAVRRVDGLTACDVRIKRDPCGGNLKSGRWEKAHHARQVHSWWIVVRKGRCEARRRKRKKA